MFIRHASRFCMALFGQSNKMKTSSLGSLSPFFFISLLLWSLTDVSSSSSNRQASYLKLQPAKPNNSYFSLRGSTFVLNCTNVAGNGKGFNLSWQRNGEWLSSRTQQIDNTTVQLRLFDTTTSDNGMYWCGPISGNKSQGVNISLTVADPPSPPHNLKWSVVGAVKREVRMFWSASSYTGGLPVDYSLKLCINDSVMNPVPPAKSCIWIHRCQAVNVLNMNRRFLCILNKADPFAPCEWVCNYSIAVIATNAVGSAISVTYLPRLQSTFQATPWPPEGFTVKPITNRKGELRVSWTARDDWKYSDTEYKVLYHTNDEMKNKTKVIRDNEFTILTGLEAFTDYYVYLMVRFIGKSGTTSAYSEILGPYVIKTLPESPVDPPMVERDHSVIFPGNSGLRNVTVEWQFADNSSWRGTPGKYVVSYEQHITGKWKTATHEYSTDATSNRTVLQRLNSSDKYKVKIRMCNLQGKCSGFGTSYPINEMQEDRTPPDIGNKLSSMGIAWITVSVVMGLVTATCAVYMVRKWRRGELVRHTPNLEPLNGRLQLYPPAPDYDYLNTDTRVDADGVYQRLWMDKN